MKKYFNRFLALSLISSAFILNACDESGIPVTLPQTIEYEFTLPSSPDSSFIVSQIVSGNIDSVLSANNASRENIQSMIILGSYLAEIDSAGNIVNNSTSIIDTINVLIGDLDKPVSEDSVIAFIPQFYTHAFSPEFGGVSLYLTSTSVDLVPYTAKPQYRISIKGNAKSALTTSKRYRLRINANLSLFL